MGLGSPPSVSLLEAREAVQEGRRQIRTGLDPIEERRRQRARQASQKFGEFADQLVADLSPQWRSPIHARQWKVAMAVHAAPLRGLDIDQIDTDDVLGMLRPIWHIKPETARRVRGRVEYVLDAAKAKGLRTGDNPARWKGHISMLLPRHGADTRGHHSALPYAQMRKFMGDLRQVEGLGAKALELTVLAVSRTNEVIGALVPEFDLAEAVWTVPGERMKGGKPHRVPLSPAAVALVRERIEAVGTGYLFPGLRRDKPLSNMTMTLVMRRMGLGKFTVHGFRSAFRDWAGDRTTFPGEVAEAALAHVAGDEVVQAYRRGDALDLRRQLMDAWAAYCDPTGSAQVIAMIARA